ncbi:GNAT family N-acetyltransferase [Pedobacter caeni]|uniref:Ferric iron reductase FhuF-like transporter n=1 Tax=Pedobacter caeni TaxID=288992 RepID=A0A1M5JTF0_9SPHI|nr:GNAT family N-acetyltransferase [Pedobacter caeni]SHG43808.1 Ferric iron reductase FhuF-like transporter [Pedobacter caeni]
MAPHDKNNQINLLLNLILREYNHWYYFDLIPKYDEDLAVYMQNLSEKGFIKISLQNAGSVLYYPLAYRSLTGFHLFGNSPAWRKAGTEVLTVITPEVALNHLIKEIYPDLSKPELQRQLENLGVAYEHSLSRELEQYVPAELLIRAEANPVFKSWQEKTENDDFHASDLFFNEFGDQTACSLLQGAILSFSRGKEIGTEKAAAQWTQRYLYHLLKSTLDLYLKEGVLLSPTYLHTGLCLDEDGLPEQIVFPDDQQTLILSRLPENFNRGKLDAFLAAHLLAHHIYPLIRAVGMIGFLREEKLLEYLNEELLHLKKEHQGKADFLDAVRLRVKAQVPQLLGKNQEDEFAERHLHLHNHVINVQYYVPELIKPYPGEVVHKRYFNNGELEIAIRAFNPETDIEILHEWVNMDYTKKFWEMDGPIKDLEEAYIKHLGVDYSHPYIGTLNGEPIFTLELYWAIKDEVGKYYPFHPGDYGFHMLIAPAERRIPNFSYYALTMCMEHFFSFDQLHRMIGEASAEHMGTHNLITKVGCEFNKALVLPYKTSNLTFCVREQFQEAVKEVLERSCTNIYVNI